MSARVKLFGRRPHEGLATRTGAGVRKAAEDETARWERQAVRQTLNRAPHGLGQPSGFRGWRPEHDAA